LFILKQDVLLKKIKKLVDPLKIEEELNVGRDALDNIKHFVDHLNKHMYFESKDVVENIKKKI